MRADAALSSRPAMWLAPSACTRPCRCSRRWSFARTPLSLSRIMGKYKRVSEAIRTIFSTATSIVEPLSLDEAYLDLTDDYRTEAPPAAEALATISRRIEGEIGI